MEFQRSPQFHPSSKWKIHGGYPPRWRYHPVKRAHNARIGVWQFGDAQVSIRPKLSKNPRHFQELRRFLHHKAFHFKVGKRNFADVWESSLISFQEWLDRVDCEGQSDPRCLPFHIFKTEVSIGILATDKGRREFAITHGPPSKRHDDNELRWKSPRGRCMVASNFTSRGMNWKKGSIGTLIRERGDERCLPPRGSGKSSVVNTSTYTQMGTLDRETPEGNWIRSQKEKPAYMRALRSDNPSTSTISG